MRFLPRSLGLRVGLALAVAVVGVVLLDATVRKRDASAAAKAPALASVAAGTGAERETRPGVRVLPVGGTVLLACRVESIEPSVAPVVQVLADGSLALRRPAPLATGPAGDPSAAGRRAAIVLPGPALRRLDPAARGALAELVGQLVAVRPVPVGRFVAVDFPLVVGDLEALLAWIP